MSKFIEQTILDRRKTVKKLQFLTDDTNGSTVMAGDEVERRMWKLCSHF